MAEAKLNKASAVRASVSSRRLQHFGRGMIFLTLTCYFVVAVSPFFCREDVLVWIGPHGFDAAIKIYLAGFTAQAIHLSLYVALVDSKIWVRTVISAILTTFAYSQIFILERMGGNFFQLPFYLFGPLCIPLVMLVGQIPISITLQLFGWRFKWPGLEPESMQRSVSMAKWLSYFVLIGPPLAAARVAGMGLASHLSSRDDLFVVAGIGFLSLLLSGVFILPAIIAAFRCQSSFALLWIWLAALAFLSGLLTGGCVLIGIGGYQATFLVLAVWCFTTLIVLPLWGARLLGARLVKFEESSFL